MSLLRRDPVTGRWTIISPGRPLADRSGGSLRSNDHFSNGPRKFCPFCSGNEHNTPPEVLTFPSPLPPLSKNWRVRVVPNRFPVLESTIRPDPSAQGIYDKIAGFGIHEVVIESPDHDSDFASLSIDHAYDVVAAWTQRIIAISSDSRIRYIMVFRNHGMEAGASLEHPHSQIIALPIVPNLVMEELASSLRYYQWKERCVFCDIVHDEITQGLRVVNDSTNFLAFAPYASRFPYELWVVPKRHRAHFQMMTPAEQRELAGLLTDILIRLKVSLDNPPFNLLLHTTPCQEGETSHYHWHIEIMPRLTKVAGFEWGTGFYLNPVLPEDAAKTLTEAHGVEH